MPKVASTRRDPAPSRTAYRMHRLWLTPLFHRILRVGLPAFLITFMVGSYFAKDENREAIAQMVADIQTNIQERPEFMVKLMAIDGAGPEIAKTIRDVLPVNFPISSFDLDLEMLRETIVDMPPVKSAALRVRKGGILQVDVTERIPAIVWRTKEGHSLLDDEGFVVAQIASRMERSDLPLIAGDAADASVGEAMALFEAATPIHHRLRGLVRMGERRWDVVLDRKQRILLPEINPVNALERVIAVSSAEDMLERDLAVVDMRNPDRPTVRIAPDTVAALRRIKLEETGAANQ